MSTVAVASLLWMGQDIIVPAFNQGGLTQMQTVMNGQLAHVLPADVHDMNDWVVVGAILWTGIVTTAITSYGENVAMKRYVQYTAWVISARIEREAQTNLKALYIAWSGRLMSS